MTTWLRCRIAQGLFSGEYAVSGKMFDGKEFSLFTTERALALDEHPTEETPVEGAIRVTPMKVEGDLCLVLLPQPTLENGRSITVHRADLFEREAVQRA